MPNAGGGDRIEVFVAFLNDFIVAPIGLHHFGYPWVSPGSPNDGIVIPV